MSWGNRAVEPSCLDLDLKNKTLDSNNSMCLESSVINYTHKEEEELEPALSNSSLIHSEESEACLK